MKTKTRSKGPWINRFAIWVFAVILGILIFWFLGFILSDIKSIRGPQYSDIETAYVKGDVLEKYAELKKKITDLSRQIDNQKETQRVIGDSSRSLQQTINQLLELRKISIQKNVTFSDSEQAEFTSSLNLFLENQKKYQELNQSIAGLIDKKQGLEEDKRELGEIIEQYREPARKEYNKLNRLHRLKLAFIQLAVLLPLLIVAVFIVFRKRKSIYFPLVLAFGIATLIKIFMVMNEYFPKRYFKYVLIIALIVVVVYVLIYFIRLLAYPKIQWLVKQYREAYERFLCPICEYPIRTGPRRFLFWTRRSVKKTVIPAGEITQEKPYTCPSCGTMLYEECTACHKIRHSLLPYCDHCGTEKQIESSITETTGSKTE
jgi:hypothetical protein